MCFSARVSFAFGPVAFTVRSPSETAGDHTRGEGTEKSGSNKKWQQYCNSIMSKNTIDLHGCAGKPGRLRMLACLHEPWSL